jgi:hypothetical protein
MGSFEQIDSKLSPERLEILASMSSLESLAFWQCAALTDAGVVHLTKLPKLREVTLDGLPGVTKGILTSFPSQVRVNFIG